jgi:PIN domain nuclease of toxin-antitoxin system
MRALLDTHTFLWWINDDPRLSERCREIIANGSNDVLFSAVSAWEIAVKARRGRLVLPSETEPYIREQVSRNRFEVLPIDLTHALRVSLLPDHHKDPFDRMLVAQAQVENLTILSADPEIARYPVRVER